MKIKNILLAGLLVPAIAFPSNDSFLSNIAAIGSHFFNISVKAVNCGVSTIRKTTDFAVNHPYIATPIYIGAGWIGLCGLYAQKNKKKIKTIEEILDGAHPNPAKHTGTEDSLWNWRIFKNPSNPHNSPNSRKKLQGNQEEEESDQHKYWYGKSKEELEKNEQHVLVALQTDFKGYSKNWFLEKINQEKTFLKNMKSQIKQCLREATLTPSLLQTHSKAPFERLFIQWCTPPRNGSVNWKRVERNVNRYCNNRYISGSKYDYAIKIARRALFYYEKKAAKLYWKLFIIQQRLDALEKIIKQKMK